MGCAASNVASEDVMLYDVELQSLVCEFVDENGHQGDNLEAACSEALYFDWCGDNELAPEVITRIKYEEDCTHGAFGKCERYHIEWFYETVYKSTCYQVVLKDNEVKIVHPSDYFASERVNEQLPKYFQEPISPRLIVLHEPARPKRQSAVIDQLKASLLSGSLEMNKGFVKAKYLTCPFSSHVMSHPDYPKDVKDILEVEQVTGCSHHDVFEGKQTRNFKGVPAAVACLKMHCEEVLAGAQLTSSRAGPVCVAHQALFDAMAGVSTDQYRKEVAEAKNDAKKNATKKKSSK